MNIFKGKHLILFFGLLLTITIGVEIYYFQKVTSLIDKKKNAPIISDQSAVKDVKPGSVFVETKKSADAKKEFENSTPAIHPKMLERLKQYIHSPDSALYILSEQTTQVLEVAKDGANVEDRRDGKVYPGKIYFPLAFKLKNTAMTEGFIWFFYNDATIKKTNVFIKKGGALKKAKITDIKVGDSITTIEKWDPSVEPDMNKLQETLVKQLVESVIYINR